MKNILLTIILSFALFMFFIPQKTSSVGLYLPFGGKVQSTQYCNDGFLLTITAPSGGVYFVSYWVAYRYQYYTVGIPRINVVGLSTTIPYTCTLGNTVQGVGFYALMIGSSLSGI